MDNRIPRYYPSVPDNSISDQLIGCYTRGSRPSYQEPRLNQDPQGQWARIASAAPSAGIQFARRRVRQATDLGSESLRSNCGSPWSKFHSTDWASHPSKNIQNSPESPQNSLKRSATSSSPFDVRKTRSSRTPPRQAKVRRLHREVLGPHPLSPEDNTEEAFHRHSSDGTPLSARTAPEMSSTLGSRVPPASQPAMGTHYSNAFFVDKTELLRDSHNTLGGYLMPQASCSSISAGEYAAKSLASSREDRHSGTNGRSPSRTISCNSLRAKRLGNDSKLVYQSSQVIDSDPNRAFSYFDDKSMRKRCHPFTKEDNNFSIKEFTPSTVDSAFIQSFPQGYEPTNVSGAANLGVSKDISGYPLITEPDEFQHMKDQMQGFHGSLSNYHKQIDFIKPNIHSTLSSTSALNFSQNLSSHLSDSTNQHSSHKFTSKDSSFGGSNKVTFNLPSDFDLTADRSGVSNPYDHTNLLPPIHSCGESAFDSSQLLHYQSGPTSMSTPESPQLDLYGVESSNEQLNRPSPNSFHSHTPVSYDTTNLNIPDTFPSQILCNSRATMCESEMTKTKASTEKPHSTKTYSPKVQKADNHVPGYSHHIRKSPGIPHDSSSSIGFQSLQAAPSTSTTSPDFISSSHDMGLLPHRRRSKRRKAKNLESMRDISYVTSKCSQVTPVSSKYTETSHCTNFPMSVSQTETNSVSRSAKLQKECSQSKQDGASGKDFMSLTDQCPNQLPQINDKTKTKSPAGGTRRRRRHAVGLICGVCGDSARSLHFGGVSCDSCKAFFRRAVIARAYPSFLCVTTGIPPRITCQKSISCGNQDEQYSGNRRETEKSSKDSSQIDSCSVSVQKEMQLGSNLGPPSLISKSFSKTDGDCVQQSYQGSSICSITSTVPTDVVRSHSGNTHPYKSAHKSVVLADETVSSSKNVDLCVKSGSYDNAVAKSNVDSLENKDLESRSISQRLLKCPPITIANRKYCQACRFQRCIDIGMEVGWVTLENDAQKKITSQGAKGDVPGKGSDDCSDSYQGSVEYKTKDVNLKDGKCKDKKENGPLDVDDYLTKEEQRQIEQLVDIYRSVFWGVPEPAYYRPALIDFPPPFETNDAFESMKQAREGIASQSTNDLKTVDIKSCSTSDTVLNSDPQESLDTSKFSSKTRKQHSSPFKDSQNEDFQASQNKTQDGGNNEKQSTEDRHHEILGQTHEHWENQHSSSDGEPASHSSLCGELNINESSDWHSSRDEKEDFNLGESIEKIIALPEDPLGVNMLRKALRRRPRPWLIRQLMGYTLRFLYVVLKLLQSVGRDMSMADRTILLRQGMTGLTFMNSVYTYDSSVEGWPERVFPPLPLVLQEGDPGSSSEQPDYLKGAPMHADEVASVVAPQVLEHQLTFIRGMKTLVGNDCTTMFLLMAIMLFDPTHEGLEEPQTVEDIQGKYCYLLKQYVSWKFRDGSPKNPGIERPSNFTPLNYFLQKTNRPASLRKEGEEVHGSKAEEVKNAPQSAEAETGFPLNDPQETAQMNDETKIGKKDPSDSDIFQFKIPEGMYFSPPYPPSPTNPSSIFPILLTRMADLKQIAHSYSSIPFLLQGSEVDEIASLLARIEVFMSDIIAMEPEPDFSDRDGSGGGCGGAGGNDTQNGDGVKHSKSSPEENFSNIDGEHDGNEKQIGDHDSLWKNVFLENCNLKWSEQHLEWDCCSSGGESNTESSLSTMSIGDSFDDIIEVLEAGQHEDMENRVACPSEEVLESICTWEKVHSMKVAETNQFNITSEEKLGQVSGFEAKPPLEDLQNYHLSLEKSNNAVQFDGGNASELDLSKNDLPFKKHKQFESLSWCAGPNNPKYDRNMNKGAMHGDGNLGPSFSDTSHQVMGIETWKRECQIACANNSTEFPFHHGPDVVAGRSWHENERHLMEEYSPQSLWSKTSLVPSKGRISPIYRKDDHSDGNIERKSFQVPHLCKGDSYVWQNKEPSQPTQQQSLWDRIKETGKALLGLDSTQNRNQDSSVLWKGGYSGVEGKVLPEDKRDVDHLLNPLERPDSNSSGYGSNVSSPPLPTFQKDLDAYNYGDDWDEFFQRL